MATITLIDLLGTDNVAVSRTDINKNFQTAENAINTLETYLDTTPAGGSLSIGSVTLNIGANPIGTNLMANQGSASILGNLTLGLDASIGGTCIITGDTTLSTDLIMPGTSGSSEIVIGTVATGNVPVKWRNIVLADETLGTTVGATGIELDTIAGTGVSDVDVTGLRTLVLNYSLAPAATTGTSANFIKLTGTPITGQRLYVKISDVANATTTFQNIYFDLTGFNAKYDAISPDPTPYNSAAAATPAAIGFTSVTENGFRRQWVELVYNGSNWEVYNAHPSVLGI